MLHDEVYGIFNDVSTCLTATCSSITMLTALVTAVLTLLLSSMMPYGTAVPLSSFYSYGSAAGDTSLPPNDDDSSPSITLPTSFNFYGTFHSTVYVSWALYVTCSALQVTLGLKT